MEKKRKKRTKYKYKFLEKYSMSRESFRMLAIGTFGFSVMFLLAGIFIISV